MGPIFLCGLPYSLGDVELSEHFQFVPNIFSLSPTCSVCPQQFQFVPNIFSLSPTFAGCPQHFQFVPNILRMSPTFSGCPQPFQFVPNMFRMSPTFPDFPTCWDQKIDIGASGPLTPKKHINFLDFWTLVKPQLKITPVSETAGKIQSHGLSGRPSC